MATAWQHCCGGSGAAIKTLELFNRVIAFSKGPAVSRAFYVKPAGTYSPGAAN